jgi:hypothetical protein
MATEPLLDYLSKPTVTDWLGVLGAFALIVITARYVHFTKKMMSATVDQARAANIAALATVQQWKFQQVQRLLPIKLAIGNAKNRIESFRRLVRREDASLLEFTFHATELEAALAIGSATSSAIALNIGFAIDDFKAADRYVQTLSEVAAPWETPEIKRIAAHLEAAEKTLQIAESWLAPLLKPVEGVAYPTDQAIDELVKAMS